MSHTLRPDALRAVWVSDVHLGSRACRATLLLDFLKRTHCEVLYLVFQGEVTAWHLAQELEIDPGPTAAVSAVWSTP